MMFPHDLSAGLIVPFAGVLLLSVAILVWSARRTRTASDFFIAGERIGPWQNALALAGDFVAAAGLLGITGLIALYGADGMVFAVGIVAGWPLIVFLFAAPLKQLGKYTLADVLTTKLGDDRLRSLVAINQLIVALTYLTAQFVGAGAILHLLFGVSETTGLLVVAVIMLVFMLMGGMLAATWLQIIKATAMICVAMLVLGACLARFDFNPVSLLHDAVSVRGPGIMLPGRLFQSPWETISLLLGLALGGASLPHVLMRMNTVADARTARKSAFLATSIIVVFHLIILMLGFAAVALLQPDAIRAADPGGNMALPLLAQLVGGDFLLGLVASIALTTILAVVAGLCISGAATLAHDVWGKVIRMGKADASEELMVGRVASMLLILAALGTGVIFQGQNIGYMSAFGLAIAASANFPALLLAIFWRPFTPAGAFAGMLSGLVLSLTLIALSPLVQIGVLHRPDTIFPLQNPGIVAIPTAFIVSVLVSLLSRRHRLAPQGL